MTLGTEEKYEKKYEMRGWGEKETGAGGEEEQGREGESG